MHGNVSEWVWDGYDAYDAAARVTHSVRHRAHQAHVVASEHQAVPVLAQRASQLVSGINVQRIQISARRAEHAYPHGEPPWS